MRTTRIRQLVVKMLEENGEMNTRSIHDKINERMKWGATMNQIGNIMAKDKRFTKLNKMDRVGNMTGRYSVCVWKLSDAGLNDSDQM
tara:strand:+ start:1783 stop:2043 length:261 start_codon:yes stop_codon:yes gene_type:complete